MSIKAIIFDLDGMLILSEPFSRQFAKAYGFADSYDEEILPFFLGPMQKCIIGQADLKEELAPYLEKWHWQKSVSDFLDYWFESENKFDLELINFIPQIRKKKLQLFLTTNQEKYRASYLQIEMDLSRFFDKMYFSCEIGFKKTDPEFLTHILKDNPFQKEEYLFWDDQAKNVTEVESFGLKSELYRDFTEFKNTMKEILK